MRDALAAEIADHFTGIDPHETRHVGMDRGRHRHPAAAALLQSGAAEAEEIRRVQHVRRLQSPAQPAMPESEIGISAALAQERHRLGTEGRPMMHETDIRRGGEGLVPVAEKMQGEIERLGQGRRRFGEALPALHMAAGMLAALKRHHHRDLHRPRRIFNWLAGRHPQSPSGTHCGPARYRAGDARQDAARRRGHSARRGQARFRRRGTRSP
jgi:hypothetical protein